MFARQVKFIGNGFNFRKLQIEVAGPQCTGDPFETGSHWENIALWRRKQPGQLDKTLGLEYR